MFRLQKISLLQFKNYTKFSVNFDQPIVGICGANGVGKTSLLDAIHYLGFTKSYFLRNDQQLVRTGSEGFRIEGEMQKGQETTNLTCILRETGKKEFLLDGVAYEKMSLHIGKFPVVVIAPDDVVLITGESKERRSFIDQLLSQLNPAYLQSLIQYNRILQQRNAFLKEMAVSPGQDLSLLEVYDEQLGIQGQSLFDIRTKFLQEYIPLVESEYTTIAAPYDKQEAEAVSIIYQSNLQQSSMLNLLRQTRAADIAAQRTTRGIHRDELLFTLLEQPFRQVASQGQRKSLLFALKLAAMQLLREHNGFSPLLLLDDVFEKLDDRRIENLLKRVCERSASQIFITDTSAQRLEKQLSTLGLPFQLVTL